MVTHNSKNVKYLETFIFDILAVFVSVFLNFVITWTLIYEAMKGLLKTNFTYTYVHV